MCFVFCFLSSFHVNRSAGFIQHDHTDFTTCVELLVVLKVAHQILEFVHMALSDTNIHVACTIDQFMCRSYRIYQLIPSRANRRENADCRSFGDTIFPWLLSFRGGVVTALAEFSDFRFMFSCDIICSVYLEGKPVQKADESKVEPSIKPVVKVRFDHTVVACLACIFVTAHASYALRGGVGRGI